MLIIMVVGQTNEALLANRASLCGAVGSVRTSTHENWIPGILSNYVEYSESGAQSDPCLTHASSYMKLL